MPSEIKFNLGRLVTVAQLAELYPGTFSVASLRHHIFQAESRTNSRGEVVAGNGLASAILRVGRKVLIDLDAFDRWLDSHRQSAMTE